MAAVVGQVERLYALPPQEFTAARDELSKRLRNNGDRDAAAAVKRLSRPTLGAWALNQAVRREPEAVSAFLTAAAKLRQAQIHGRGDLSAAGGAERRARAVVAGAARQALRESGRDLTDSVDRTIRKTLRAAAADADAAAALKRGQLATAVAPPAADELLRQMKRRPPKKRAPSCSRRGATDRAAGRATVAAARAELAEARRAARTVSDDERRLRRQYQSVQRRAEQARRRVEEAQERLRQAQDLESPTTS